MVNEDRRSFTSERLSFVRKMGAQHVEEWDLVMLLKTYATRGLLVFFADSFFAPAFFSRKAPLKGSE